MIKNTKYSQKLAEKIEICTQKIEDGENEELWGEKLTQYFDRLAFIKSVERKVSVWEKSNHKWFNGSANDVCTYSDLASLCAELQFDEKPLDLIMEGTFIPIMGSSIEPWDLRHYLYLPSVLVEEDEDIATIRKAFEGFGDTLQ